MTFSAAHKGSPSISYGSVKIGNAAVDLPTTTRAANGTYRSPESDRTDAPLL